jgi:hypothetical protein
MDSMGYGFRKRPIKAIIKIKKARMLIKLFRHKLYRSSLNEVFNLIRMKNANIKR